MAEIPSSDDGAMMADLPGPGYLTPCQLETLRLRAMGMTYKEVAARLRVSQSTAKGHTRDAYERLGVPCFADALRSLGWLRVPEISMIAVTADPCFE